MGSGRVGWLVDPSGSFSRVAGLSGLKNRGGGKSFLTSLVGVWSVDVTAWGGAWTKKYGWLVGGVAKEENNGRESLLFVLRNYYYQVGGVRGGVSRTILFTQKVVTHVW